MNKNYNQTTKTQRRSTAWVWCMMLFILFGLSSALVNAQPVAPFSGSSYTIDPSIAASSTNWQSMSAAFTALNTSGVTGAVTITCNKGQSETASSNLGMVLGSTTLNASLSNSNTLTFVSGGSGANYKVNAAAGGLVVPATNATQNGIIALVGADYVTFDGIDLADANTGTAAMEYGYAMYKASATDGCQNNTIKNCVITLFRTNNTATAPSVPATGLYGSTGIAILNSIQTVPNTALTITASTGANSNNKIYTNTIQFCNTGIAIIGFNYTTLTGSFYDNANDIGGSTSGTAGFGGAGTGNLIKDFGPGTSTINCYGIRAYGQYNINIRYNTINNDALLSLYALGNIWGVLNGAALSAPVTISNNTVTLRDAGTATTLTGIENQAGSTANANTIAMSNNTITGILRTSNTTGATYGIWNNGASSATLTMNSNSISGNTLNNAGSAVGYLLYNTGAVTTTINMNSNTITGSTIGTGSSVAPTGLYYLITNTGGVGGATGTTTININSNTLNGSAYNIGTANGSTGATYYFIYNTGLSIAENIQNNTISNATGLKTQGTIAGIYVTGTSKTRNINGNTIQNITRTVTTGSTGGFYGVYAPCGQTWQTTATTGYAAAVANINGNTVTNINMGVNTGTTTYLIGAYGNWTTNIYNNTVSNVVMSSFTSTAYCLYPYYYANTFNVYNNDIHDITFGTAGTSYLMYQYAYYAQNYNTYSNSFYNISGSASTIYCVYAYFQGYDYNSGVAYPTCQASTYQNQWFNISTANTSGVIYGFYNAGCVLDPASTNPAYKIYNNKMTDLRTTASTSMGAIVGVYASSTSNMQMYYNTINLNATSSSATTFGTKMMYVAAASPVIIMKNNIFVNNSTPGTTTSYTAGLTAVSLAALASTTSSNNLWYCGTPGATKIMYGEFTGTTATAATNAKTTLGAMQAYTSKDANSITENPAFQAVSGVTAIPTPTLLNFASSTVSQAEGAGVAISGITTDYQATTRGTTNSSTPDMGAYEFFGISPTPSVSAVSASPAGAKCTTVSRAITATASAPSGYTINNTVNAASGVFINYSINGTAQTPILMTNTTGNIYTGTLPASIPTNATIVWNVSVVDYSNVSNTTTFTATSASTTYQDDPYLGLTLPFNVSPTVACQGNPVTLSSGSAILPTGYGASSATSTDDDELYDVSLGTGASYTNVFSHTSTCSSVGGGAANGLPASSAKMYSNYTNLGVVATLTSGSTYNFRATFYYCLTYVPSSGIKMAIDYNRDGTFGANEIAYVTPSTVSTSAGIATVTGSFTIPFLTSGGYTLMRIVDDESVASPPITGTYTWGETEDYMVNVQPAFSYSWSDGSSIVGTTNPLTYTPPAAGTLSYTAIGTDVSGCTIGSTPQVVTINTQPTAPTSTPSTQCGIAVPAASVASTNTTGGTGQFSWYNSSNVITGVLQQAPPLGPLATYYSNTFTSATLTNSSLAGVAAISSGILNLKPVTAGVTGGLLVNAANNGANPSQVIIDLDLLFTSGTALAAGDGIGISFGDDATAGASLLSAEHGSGSKLRIAFQAYNALGGASDPRGIYIAYNPSVANYAVPVVTSTGVLAYNPDVSWIPLVASTTVSRHISISINALGQLSLSLTPVGGGAATAIFTNLQLPAAYLAANKSTWKYAFDTRSGGATGKFDMDNLVIQTDGTNGPGTTTYLSTIAVPTTFYVSEMGTNGCASPRTATVANVSYGDAITANSTSSTNTPALNLCLGSSHNLSLSQTGTNGNVYTFTWSATPSAGSGLTTSTTGNGGTSTGPITLTNILPTVAGTYTYNVYYTDGVCSGNSTVTVVVNPLPAQPGIVASVNPICAGSPSTMYAYSPGSTAVVGTGTTTFSSVANACPFTTNYGSAHSQYIVKASELTAAGLQPGPITGLRFNLAAAFSAYTAENYQIKMGHTSATAFASAALITTQSTTGSPALQLCYSGKWPVGSTTALNTAQATAIPVGLQTIPFSAASFNWDGVSNVVIDITHMNCSTCNTTSSCTTAFSTNASWTGHTATFNSSMVIYADGNCTITSMAPSGGSTAFGAWRPNITFIGNAIPSGAVYNYTWNNGASNFSTAASATVTPASTTSYTLKFTNPTSLCTNTTAPFVLTVNPVPTAPTTTAGTHCGLGLPAALVTSTTGYAGSSFKWYTAATAGTLLQTATSTTFTTPTSATATYYVSEIATSGCEGARTSVVETVNVPDAVTAANTATLNKICLNGSFNLNATKAAGSNVYSYTWSATPSTGSGLPTTPTGASLTNVMPTVAGVYTYTVTGVDASGAAICTASASTTVTVNILPTGLSAPTVTNGTVCGNEVITLSEFAAGVGLPTGYLASNALNTIDEEILGFSLTCAGGGTLSTTSPCGTTVGGNSIPYEYSDYTSLAATNLVLGGAATGSIIRSYCNLGTNYSNIWAVYIDYNRDGSFTGTGEQVAIGVYGAATQPPGTTDNFSFTIPTNASTGNTLMRVVLVESSVVSPTGTYSWGETEDYIVNILPPYTYTWNIGASTNVASGYSTTTNAPTVGGNYNVVAVASNSFGCTANTAPTVLTVNALPAAPTASAPSTQCGLALPNVSVSNGTGTHTWAWYASATPGAAALQTATTNKYTTPISATTTFYVAQVNAASGCESYPRVAAIANVTSPNPIAITNNNGNNNNCWGAALSLTAAKSPNTGVNVYTYKWCASPLTGSGLANCTTSGATITPTPTIAGVYVYTVTATDATLGCVTTASITITELPNLTTATVSTQAPTTCGQSGSILVSPPISTASLTTLFQSNFNTSTLNSTYEYICGTPTPSYNGSYLILTANTISQEGNYQILNPNGIDADIWQTEFDLATVGVQGADGFSYNFGDNVAPICSVNGQQEVGNGDKLHLSFDAYTNGSNVAGIYLTYGSITNPTGHYTPNTPSVGSNPDVLAYANDVSWTGGATSHVTMTINAGGQVTVLLGSTVLFNNVQLPAAYLTANKSTWTHLFMARTGGISQGHQIGSVSVKYVPRIYKFAKNYNAPSTWQTSSSFVAATGSYPMGIQSTLNTGCVASLGTAVVSSAPTLTVSASALTGCPGATTILSFTPALTGYTYQWESSTTSATAGFTPIAGQTAATLTWGVPATSTWYRVVVTCSGVPTTSAAINIAASGAAATVPFIEDFESITTANTLPTCMSYGSGNANVMILGQDLYTPSYITYSATYTSQQNHTPAGSKFASFYYYNSNGSNYINDRYIYTSAIHLVAGTTYQASCWYAADGASASADWNLYIKYGPGQTPTGMTTIAKRDATTTPAGINGGPSTGGTAQQQLDRTLQQLKGTFTPTVTGDYVIAVEAKQTTTYTYYALSVDDIEVLAACSGTPASPTLPSTATACTGRTTTLNVGSSSAFGLTYLWEYSTTGTGSWTSTGVTTPTFTTHSVQFPGSNVSAVGTATNNTGTGSIITIANHGYTNGQAIIYLNGGGASIGGLTSGTTYYVIYLTANTFRLASTYLLAVPVSGNATNLLLTTNTSTIHAFAKTTLPASTTYYRCKVTCGTLFSYSNSCAVSNVICEFNIARNIGNTYTDITTLSTVQNPTYVSNTTIWGDDNLTNPIAMPSGFNFTYNGTTVTAARMCVNGWLTLDAASLAPSTTGENTVYTANLATAAAPYSVVAPFWTDLQVPGYIAPGTNATLLNAALSYVVTGSAPNRIVTFQWKGMEKYASPGSDFNFQVKLYESSIQANHKIEIVYGPMTTHNGAVNTYVGVMSGIKGASVSATPVAGECYVLQELNTNRFDKVNQASPYMNSAPQCNTSYMFVPGTGYVTPAANTSAPSNDNPIGTAGAGATLLSLNGGPCTDLCYKYYNTKYATASGNTVRTGGTQANADDDVWFTFTLPSSPSTGSTGVGVTVNNGYGNMYTYEIWNSALTSIVAYKVSSGVGLSASDLYTYGTGAGQLTSGSTYYIRVYNDGAGYNTYGATYDGIFSICAYENFPPPANDNPCGATGIYALSSSTGTACTLTNFSTVAATQSLSTTTPNVVTMPATPICGAVTTYNNDDDVWFTYTANNPTATIYVQGNGAFDPVVELFTASGSCATSLTLTASSTYGPSCNNATGTGGLETINLTNLVSGVTKIYIRVYHKLGGFGSGSFGMCILSNTPPANDACANAQTLTFGTSCNAISATSAYATLSQAVNAGCGSTNPDDDVWFTVTRPATASSMNIIVTGSANYDPVFEVFTGSVCGSLTSLGCTNTNSNTSNATESKLFSGLLAAATTYRIRVYNAAAGFGSGTFSICVYSGTAPPNTIPCASINASANSGHVAGVSNNVVSAYDNGGSVYAGQNNNNVLANPPSGPSMVYYTGSTAYAYAYTGEPTPSCGSVPSTPKPVWYKFRVPTFTAGVTLRSVTTYGQSMTPILAAYTLVGTSQLCNNPVFTQIGCSSTGTLTLSSTALNAYVGQYMYVQLQGNTSVPSGNYTLSIQGVVNGITLTNPTTTSLRVNFPSFSAPAPGKYVVYWRKVGSTGANYVNLSPTANYTINGLSSNQTYEVWVKFVDISTSTGSQIYCAKASLSTTPGCGGNLSAPSVIGASGHCSVVSVSWPSPSAQGVPTLLIPAASTYPYRLVWYFTNGTGFHGSVQAIASLPSTGYGISGLQLSQNYAFYYTFKCVGGALMTSYLTAYATCSGPARGNTHTEYVIAGVHYVDATEEELMNALTANVAEDGEVHEFNLVNIANQEEANQDQVTSVGTFELIPNPTSNTVSVDYSLPATNLESLVVKVMDVQGKVVREETIKTPNQYGNVKFDLSDVEAGVYLVNIQTEGYTETKKLVVSK
jgi:hypothetical protein